MTNKFKQQALKYLLTLKAFGYENHEPFRISSQEKCLKLSDNLKLLQKDISNCSLCTLSKSRSQICFGSGNQNVNIMFVGLSPNIIEDETGDFFGGNSGSLLEKIILNVLNLQKNDVYCTNLVKCKTPNNRIPSADEISCCRQFLLQQIAIIKPKLIVALDEEPFKYLSGIKNCDNMRGQIIEFNQFSSLMFTYSPNFLLRNPSLKKEAFDDFKKIKNFLNNS